MNIIIIATEKPINGESNNAKPVSFALSQLTADTPRSPGKNAKAKPIPKIDPIIVCELDEGIPKYQVPKFQIIELNNNANIIAIPSHKLAASSMAGVTCLLQNDPPPDPQLWMESVNEDSAACTAGPH